MTDLIWVAVLGAASLMVIVFLIDGSYSRQGLAKLFTLIFVHLVFWVFLIRQIRGRFVKQSTNFVLICAAVLSILTTSWVIKLLGTADLGWTVYPPLSATSHEAYDSAYELTSFVYAYQLFLIVTLGFASVMFGRGIENYRTNRR